MANVRVLSDTRLNPAYIGRFPVQFICCVGVEKEGETVLPYDWYTDLDGSVESWQPDFHWCPADGKARITSLRRGSGAYSDFPLKELHEFSIKYFAEGWWNCFQKTPFVTMGVKTMVREPFKEYV